MGVGDYLISIICETNKLYLNGTSVKNKMYLLHHAILNADKNHSTFNLCGEGTFPVMADRSTPREVSVCSDSVICPKY